MWWKDIIKEGPVQEVKHPLLQREDIKLFVKREDLVHNEISGNKWHKLKYNLAHIFKSEKEGIITFGGAFSNHIYATAAACKYASVPCIGIIRGEEDVNNPTLKFAKNAGMKLYFVSRSAYREKEKAKDIVAILEAYPHHHIIPEGGDNELGLKGMKKLADALNKINADVVLVSAGTGNTARGLMSHIDTDLWVFPALKHKYLQDLLKDHATSIKYKKELRIVSEYHFGGFAKYNDELVDFMYQFESDTGIPLDPIYNSKLVYGFFDMVKSGKIENEKTYLWVHTGGLQGTKAMKYMEEKKSKKG